MAEQATTAGPHDAQRVDFDLTTRYVAGAGPALLTGVQAIARLLVEQHAADQAAGLNTATFVSGYQGSPLGGLDQTLAKAKELREHAGLTLVPGLNEELGATSVWGSQLEIPGHGRTVDGVVGLWYGKAPGVDRSGDPFRHGNLSGAHPKGGVLVLAGDDPGCKSSTIPCQSDRTLAGFGLPVLYPRDAAEIIRLGRFGIELSRASGMWIGVKVIADVADGVFELFGDETPDHVAIPEIEWDGEPWHPTQYPILMAPHSLRAEEEMVGPRSAMVQAFLDANPVNRIELDSPDAWLGIVAPGKAYSDLVEALRNVGLDADACERAGIRLLRLGMVHPLQESLVRDFANGLEQILVVEEKTPFIEGAIRDLLYLSPNAPTVIGANDTAGAPLVPIFGGLSAALLEEPLRRVLSSRPGITLKPVKRSLPTLDLLPVSRTPYFCSGCPHNRSTTLPDGAVAGGGIGCHVMVTVGGREESEVTSLTQMGGEGAQWIGQSPFTEVSHIFQNVGDGTFAHSGQLALQACIAAGVSITYKLLYNRTVAMTGGQDAQGGLEVPALTTKLLAEGVKRVIVCADEPQRYRNLAPMPKGAVVWNRDRLDEAQRELAGIDGVTVLIYDQQCAAEARRLRKRGAIPTRTTRVIINEAVCEGCGDCGVKSNCLSVEPVETEFGRKTRIDQTTCNTDYSCLDGNCPSFVTVEVDPTAKPASTRAPEPPAVPDVTRPRAGDIFLAGIGGTGIITVNQILGSAAVRDGLAVHGVDQTGLSQKAGPVTSHLRIAAHEKDLGPAVLVGTARSYLAFDALVGADAKNLRYADPDLTAATISTSSVPTGTMVRDVNAAAADVPAMVSRIAERCHEAVSFDAQVAARALFGDAMPANLLIVGAAYQAGALPISADAIEWAIRLNGVAIDANIAAFRWGRVAVADRAAFDRATTAAGDAGTPPEYTGWLGDLSGETRRLVSIRAAQLVDYQDRQTAQRYVADMQRVWRAERQLGEQTAFSEAVARGLHKLTAYKDEYEVARLLTTPAFDAQVTAAVPGAGQLEYRLHPPTLKALGRDKKIALGQWSRPALVALARGKRLRGTRLDPFGRTEMRRLEQSLRDEYRSMVLHLTGDLAADNYDVAVDAANAADLIRGYEEVKLESVQRYRARLAQLGL
jgi:indolepyruvate ferredoxin oxidoreductase